MTTIFAKTFIILTLIFEVITITAGPTLYPIFAAACGIVFACLGIQILISKIRKICAEHRSVRKLFLIG